jgi:hypothetical protein
MPAKKSVGASAREPYSDAPVIFPDHPLVCNRRSEVPIGDFADPESPIYRKHTLGQRWLVSKGFHSGWWLPEPLATQWKTSYYPLKATPESIAQWQGLMEQLAAGPDANGSCQQSLFDLQHDLKLLESFDSKLVAFGPVAPGPVSK